VASADLQARTREIMRSVKATTAPAAAPTATGQGPGFISPGPSPLVASYGEWTSGRSMGIVQSLPRDQRTFLSGMFGPLTPLQVVPVDTPQPGDDRAEPRRFQYPVGWDMPQGMPGTEGLGKLADFTTLRTLADLYSVARACIDLRKAELRGIGWDIVLTKNAAKALRGSSSGMQDFAKRRAQAIEFWRRPDPYYPDFSSWFDTMLEEVFVTDALALYVQPARGQGKGVLGSSLGALDLIDGSLIRPLVDIRGGKPTPPNPAYQQYLYGVPRVDLMTLLLGEDNPEEQGLVAEYAGDQLMYLPFNQRTWTPYGQTPVERAIIPIMTGLNRQQYQLNYYQEGSIPGLFVSPGDPNMTPAQIRELQDALNALAGDQAWKHKIIVLPGGSRVDPQKPASLADQFDEIMMTQVCMAFQVMPMELGISPRVSSTQSTGAANQMAKASQDIQERKGVVPLLLWLKSAIFDRVLQGICGQDDMEWQWEGLEEDEDAETLTNLLVQQVSAGMRSIDEARQELGLDPWNLPITSDPGWATQMGGFVSFTVPPPAPPALPGQPPPPGQPQGQQQPPKPPSKPGQVQPPQNKPPTALTAPRKPPAGDVTGGGTPAHAASGATPDAAPNKPAGTSASKAQLRELSLLRSHLRRGGDLDSWQSRDLPGYMLAIIAEDLTKGLDVDQVIGGARDLIAKGHTDVTPVHGHGDLTHEVYAYLARHYPATVLEWVKEARWTGPHAVPLARINMARRPGGARNEAKVQAIRQHVEDGGHLDPVVLVQVPGQAKYEIADGWHRTAGVRDAGGTTIRAWIGRVDTSSGPWDQAMNEAKLNKAGAGMLIRHTPPGGQTRYLLQRHSATSAHPGTWDNPGGHLHDGETPTMGAVRETVEELGHLPKDLITRHMVSGQRDGEPYHTVICDSPAQFTPAQDGATPDETADWGWFTQAEIAALDTHPAFTLAGPATGPAV
jgi:8-oxo-dGTP pyrophosphatase MutT (NUDIX family)